MFIVLLRILHARSHSEDIFYIVFLNAKPYFYLLTLDAKDLLWEILDEEYYNVEKCSLLLSDIYSCCRSELYKLIIQALLSPSSLWLSSPIMSLWKPFGWQLNPYTYSMPGSDACRNTSFPSYSGVVFGTKDVSVILANEIIFIRENWLLLVAISGLFPLTCFHLVIVIME